MVIIHIFLHLVKRKYLRDEGSTDTKQFHQSFKAWVKFKNHTTISDEEWQVLSEEDEAHPYEEYPTSNPPLAATNQEQRRGEQHQEQQVYDEAVQQSEQQRGEEPYLHPVYDGFEETY